jgi:acyl-CoA reductase-like NAD-dependent aldehyde dehydrogenase
MLRRLADALQSRAADTNEPCTRENGMPIRLSRGANGVFPATLLRYYADMIALAEDEEIRPSMIGHTIERRAWLAWLARSHRGTIRRRWRR